MVTPDDGLNRDAARGVCLRVEEALGTHDAVGAGTLEVGGGQVMEVVLILQDVHRRVVDGQEGCEVVEPVGRLHLLHGALSDVHAVLAGEGQLQIRLKRALQV